MDSLTGHIGAVWGCGFSCDGAWAVSGSNDHTMRVWDVVDGVTVQTLAGHDGPVTSCEFSRGGRYVVSGSADQTTRIWETQTGRVVRAFSRQGGPVNACCWTRTNRDLVIAGHGDGRCFAWDPYSDSELPVQTFRGHRGIVYGVQASPVLPQMASCADDGTARLWDLTEGALIGDLRIADEGQAVTSCAFSADPRQLFVTTGREVQTRDLRSGEQAAVFSGHSDLAYACAASADGHSLWSGGWDGTVRLWDTRTGRQRHVVEFRGGRVLALTVSRDGRRSASGWMDASLRICDAALLCTPWSYRDTA